MGSKLPRLAVTLLLLAAGCITPAKALGPLAELTEQFFGMGCDSIDEQFRTWVAPLSIYPPAKLDVVFIDIQPELMVRLCAEKLADFSCSPAFVEAMTSVAELAPTGTSSVPFLDIGDMKTAALTCGAVGVLSWATGIGGGFIDTTKKCGIAYGSVKAAAALYQAVHCDSRSESAQDIAQRIDLPMGMSSLPSENFELAVQQAINTAARQGQITEEEARAVRAEIVTRRLIITGQ